MKILIAGLGSIGTRHLRNLVALGEKDIVLYRTHSGSLPDQDRYDFPVESDLQKAFAHQPEAVIISNPTSLHMPIAVLAAEENAHIFLEKPISDSIESLIPFENALKTSSSKVFVGYQFRFNPGLKGIKRIIEEEEIGRPIAFECDWGEYLPGWHPWEDYRTSYAAKKDLGGGVVLTLSHPFDYLRWIFGEIHEVYATTGKFSDLELDCEDTANILITCVNGVIGDLHLDYYQQPKKHELSIICTGGRIHWEYETSRVCIRKVSGEMIEIGTDQIYESNQMYRSEMAHFLDICKKGVRPECGFNDGKKALEIAWGILQSGKYHKRVIFE